MSVRGSARWLSIVFVLVVGSIASMFLVWRSPDVREEVGCSVGDTSIPCEFIEASSDDRTVGRGLTAVGDGFSLRCVTMGSADILNGSLCRQLLDLT